MDHHFRCGAEGTAEGFEDKYTYGRRANGIYVPRYQNYGNDKRDYLRGFGYQGGASRGNWQADVAELAFGADFKNNMSKPADHWKMGLGGFGEKSIEGSVVWVELKNSKKEARKKGNF